MTVHVSFHENLTTTTRDGQPLPALGPRLGNASTLAVSASKANSSAAPKDCLVLVKVVTACRLEIGAQDAVHNANSEGMTAGFVDTRFIRAGERVSVVASA